MSGASQGIGPAADRLAHVTGVLDVSSRRDLAGCGSARGSDGVNLAAGASASAVLSRGGPGEAESGYVNLHPQGWGEAEIKLALDLDADGMMSRDIARKVRARFGMGRTEAAVRNVLRKYRAAGVVALDPRHWPEAHVQLAVALKGEGKPAEDIVAALAREFGAHRSVDGVRKMFAKRRSKGLMPPDHNRSKAAVAGHDRQAAERAASLSVRSCMRCRAGFFSEGIHNRICSPCKLSADFQGLGA